MRGPDQRVEQALNRAALDREPSRIAINGEQVLFRSAAVDTYDAFRPDRRNFHGSRAALKAQQF